jgi:hypothetical protein
MEWIEKVHKAKGGWILKSHLREIHHALSYAAENDLDITTQVTNRYDEWIDGYDFPTTDDYTSLTALARAEVQGMPSSAALRSRLRSQKMVRMMGATGSDGTGISRTRHVLPWNVVQDARTV